MDFRKLHLTFVEEAAEHIDILENGLLKLEKQPGDTELLNSIFRSAHTIKGSSGTIGLPDIARFTHIIEEILESMRSGEMAPFREMISTLLESIDIIKEMVAAVAHEELFDFQRCLGLMERMNSLKGECGEPFHDMTTVTQDTCEDRDRGVGAKYQFIIRLTPPRDLFLRGIDPSKLFRELRELGEIVLIEADQEDLPPLSDLDPMNMYLRWIMRINTDHDENVLRDVFMFIEDTSDIEITSLLTPQRELPMLGKLLAEEGLVSEEDVRGALVMQKKLGEILVEQGKTTSDQIDAVLDIQVTRKTESFKKAVTSSIRVDLAKLDHLVNLVGEMVIIHSMFQQVMYGPDGEGVAGSASTDRREMIFGQLQRIGKDIQEGAMALRMLPVGEVFQRFTRLVRELSSNKGKNVELVISGEETEMDKGVLEKIADPLVHLIRNAVDHGIEPSIERKLLNKPEQATIHLRAFQVGDAVFIEVQDDGRGLDREKILAKAVAKRLVSITAQLSDDEIYDLIFLPGFSTADVVSDLSGRGVGMDVVRKNIDVLNGTVKIKTRKGAGTTISIRLPLTLAIIDGLTMGIGGEIFIIPITSVIESLRPHRKDITSIEEKGDVVNVRGEFIPLIRLYQELDIPCGKMDPCEAIVVVTQHDNRKYGFLADDLLGEQQVVLKNLGSATPKVRAIAGGAIMGDGRVALVMDVAGVIETACGQL